MIKVITLIGAIYFGAILFLSNWLIVASFLVFLLLIYLTKVILKINNVVDLKKELSKHWGELSTSIIGSIILPYLVFVKSESDTSLAILFGILIVPNAILINYLWLRGVNKLFLVIKIKMLNTKSDL